MSSSFLSTCNIFIYIWNVSIIIPKRRGEVYNNVKVTFSLFKYSGLMTVIAHLLVSKNKMRRGQWSHLQLRASLAFVCLHRVARSSSHAGTLEVFSGVVGRWGQLR